MSQEEFTRCGCRQINMRQRHDLNRHKNMVYINQFNCPDCDKN